MSAERIAARAPDDGNAIDPNISEVRVAAYGERLAPDEALALAARDAFFSLLRASSWYRSRYEIQQHPSDQDTLKSMFIAGYRAALAASSDSERDQARIEIIESLYSLGEEFGCPADVIGTRARIEWLRGRLSDPHNSTAASGTDRAAIVEEWKPIETAPKDGDEFLAFLKSGDQMVVFYDEPSPDAPSHCWHRADGLAYHRDLPTHWRPLPDPPALAQQEPKP